MKDFMAAAKALSDEGRVRIVAALAGQELCVCELIELLELAPSTVSKHLSLLKQARIIEGRRSGRWTYYRLAGDDARVEVLAAIEWVRSSLGDDPVARRDRERISEIVAGRTDACSDSPGRLGAPASASARQSEMHTRTRHQREERS